jgi:predicted SprT family Zn-dependent metalloprotease
MFMQRPQLNPSIDDLAPTDEALTKYDELHLITYLRLLDAEKADADWQEVAKVVLHIDPVQEFERAKRAWESHLARARWMTEHGYRHLLNSAAP